MATQRFGFSLEKSPKFNRELRRLKATPKKIEKAIKEELITMAVGIRNHIIRSMRATPRVTRLRTNSETGAQFGNYNWMSGGKLHIPSSPGNAPAVDTGDLIKSIKMGVRDNEVEVGSNLTGEDGKYPKFLEFGTKNMEARPWLAPAFADEKRVFFSTIRENLLRAIRK